MKFSELLGKPLQNLDGLYRTELCFNYLNLSNNDTVCEIGCGSEFTSFIFADAINTLLSNSNLRAKMGKSARENAEKYGCDVIVKRILDIYQDLSR
jgi:protein-L-isoaspartate O-methyltransferase